MTKEALQIALEALTDFDYDKRIKAIEVIKEALETKDEPVAWMSEDEHTVYTSKQVDGCFQHDHIPLYTTPQLETKNEPVAWEQFHEHMAGPNYVAPQRTWVGLTDEEIDQGLLRSFYALQSAGAWREGVAWAMQQLKDKNNV